MFDNGWKQGYRIVKFYDRSINTEILMSSTRCVNIFHLQYMQLYDTIHEILEPI